MSDVVWSVTCGLYVPSSGAASGLHLFVSPGRVTTALKVGTCVPRCTASFSRTLESLSAPLGEIKTLLLRRIRKTAESTL